jgi:2-polyprenyl-6-methoxyphenol hydroxylase-like FAD-dependent oxidoreductase
MTNTILIVGGGIAGPALAIALRRAKFDVVVYEGSRVPRDEAGVFVNLPPNGLNVLNALGLSDRIDGLGFLNDRLVFHSDTGRVLADIRTGGVTILRGVVSRTLREAAVDAGVRFEFGKRLESISEREGGVVAAFGDGTTARGRLLIGADGIHSRCRDRFFPEAPRPSYTGLINLGGIVRTDLPSTGAVMHMVFGRRGFFGYAVRPSGDTYWFSDMSQAEEPARDGLDLIDAPSWLQRLLEIHEDDPPEVTSILQAVDGHIGAYPVHELPSVPHWHRGPVCLIGDAAHAVGPHLRQSAALALEDAFVLAKCLRDVRNDPVIALATFEQLRRERVERALKQSRRIGQRKAPGSLIGRKIRELILPTFLRRGARATEWMYGYRVNWDERISG